MAIPFDADWRGVATSRASALALALAAPVMTPASLIDVAADVPAISPWLLSGGVGARIGGDLDGLRAAGEASALSGSLESGSGIWL